MSSVRLECAKWPSRLVVTGGTSKDLFGCCYNLQTTQHTAGKDTHWLNVFLQGLTLLAFCSVSEDERVE